MENNLIPFGKYKGQPLDVLQNDKQYLDWLMVQDWFKERYPQYVQIIVNNFSEPSETPEHNKLQGLFLEDEFCFKIISLCKPNFFKKAQAGYEEEWTFGYAKEKVKILPYHNKSITKQFEYKGIDVYIKVVLDMFYVRSNGSESKITDEISIGVEIKPILSDDYPAVLRQMKANQSTVLFTTAYTGRGITLGQLKKLFVNENRIIIIQNEL